jgi:hypothetical protein
MKLLMLSFSIVWETSSLVFLYLFMLWLFLRFIVVGSVVVWWRTCILKFANANVITGRMTSFSNGTCPTEMDVRDEEWTKSDGRVSNY